MMIVRLSWPTRGLLTRHVQVLRSTPLSCLFSNTAPGGAKQNPPRPKLPEDTFTEVFLCGSGPGGQKINKTASAVQLKHIPTGIVVKYQDTRSREQNRKIARQLLAQRVDEHLNGDEARSMVVQREVARKKASSGKKSRRKYRLLEEEKAATKAATEGDEKVGDKKNQLASRVGEILKKNEGVTSAADVEPGNG
jgi:protein subunit release factor B